METKIDDKKISDIIIQRTKIVDDNKCSPFEIILIQRLEKNILDSILKKLLKL